jgi:DNA-binding GntR family transcriptional regulator/transcriptional regulator with XRE-family HTH domain
MGIKNRRGFLGMSQTQLAEALGVSQQTIARWEKAATAPSKHLAELARVLDCPIDELLMPSSSLDSLVTNQAYRRGDNVRLRESDPSPLSLVLPDRSGSNVGDFARPDEYSATDYSDSAAPAGLGRVTLGPERTVEQMIVRALRSAIIDGRLRPGARLLYRDLARQFRVSVTPVRGAVRELAKEGMVEVRPHSGAQVAPLSTEELEELYATRAGLEPWLARLGAERLSMDDLTRMEPLLELVHQSAQARDREAYLDAVWSYRAICYKAADRDRLYEIVSILVYRSARYNHLTVAEDDRLDQSLEFIERFGQACRSRNPLGAQTALREALEWSLLTALDAYERRVASEPMS